MKYELDFFPINAKGYTSVAITARWGISGNYQVLVYDGGTRELGKVMVNHIKAHYQTERVDYVVSSHPDPGHTPGLSIVLNHLEIGELWLHRPWEYSYPIRTYFKDRYFFKARFPKLMKTRLRAAYLLERLAIRKNIPIYEPFQGNVLGPFIVLSPHQDWYIHELVAAFGQSVAAEAMPMPKYRPVGQQVIIDDWRDNQTSAENESSVILLGDFDGHAVLLTGSAGAQSLKHVVDYAESHYLDLPANIQLIQMPYHEMSHNLSDMLLNRLLGAEIEAGNKPSKTAFVAKNSAVSQEGLINALLLRGAHVVSSKDSIIRYSYNMPAREGWVTAAS